MATLNPVASKTNPILKQFLNHRPIYAKPISCFCSRTPPPPFFPSFFTIRASSSSSSSSPKIPKPLIPKTPNENSQNPFFSFVKPTLIVVITASAILFTRFFVFPKPAFSCQISPAEENATEPEEEDSGSDEVEEESMNVDEIVSFSADKLASYLYLSEVTDKELKEKKMLDAGSEEETERERELEERLVSDPDDVEALRDLLDIKINNKKMSDAVNIIDRLIELEPNEPEWPLVKSHLYLRFGEVELAKVGFSEILKNDPFRAEAYHGLIMAALEENSSIEELKEIEKKVEEGMEICKEENKKIELRDFKLVLALIRVIEGKYDDALKVYDELLEEEPNDMKPHLCRFQLSILPGKLPDTEILRSIRNLYQKHIFVLDTYL